MISTLFQQNKPNLCLFLTLVYFYIEVLYSAGSRHGEAFWRYWRRNKHVSFSSSHV